MLPILKLVPIKVWGGIALAVIIALAFTYTYNKGYRAAEMAITSEQQVAYDKLLTKSLITLNTQLDEALAKRETDLKMVQELNVTLEKSKESNSMLEESLDEITSKPNPCNTIRDDYFKLYQELYKTPSK